MRGCCPAIRMRIRVSSWFGFLMGAAGLAFSALCAGGAPGGACCSARPFLAAEAYDVEVSESVVGGASESAARWVLVDRVLLAWGGASAVAPPPSAKAVIRRCAARSSVY